MLHKKLKSVTKFMGVGTYFEVGGPATQGAPG